MTEACDFCSGDGGAVLWRDDALRVVLADEPGYPGFLRVIWNAHVREMTDLDAGGRDRCMRAVYAAESAVRTTFDPAKVNLASLGNRTPHLHWHVIPRHADDPHFPGAVWGEPMRPAPARAPVPVERLRAALAASLGGARQ